jgi:hypothetical protein
VRGERRGADRADQLPVCAVALCIWARASVMGGSVPRARGCAGLGGGRDQVGGVECGAQRPGQGDAVGLVGDDARLRAGQRDGAGLG